MSNVAWQNAALAVHGSAPKFLGDLALKHTNSGEHEAGAAAFMRLYANSFDYDWQSECPWVLFDTSWSDLEAIERIWPAFQMAAEMVGAKEKLPDIADFMMKRMPAYWQGGHKPRHTNLVSWAVMCADKIDDIVSMFAVGNEPTGSKDPYKGRRQANHILQNTLLPNAH
jgi:hypothetical protein